ncbi:recombinase family protein [Microbulbifer sp. CAU 1566]|uniref:recombinase family protein n=1 Tax=Microbulbifer sp. CAU 1566 TaxID=2933269 RepID=UPI002003CE01|nr:recombinase family protein [Microbulbifer sp. CAU 1566]MCK7598213.1 recombinase family protein [Microbulbifer sp. CAU 1566]
MTGQRIGYARVSTVGQKLDVQLDALKDCDRIYQEKASGATAERSQLKEMLRYVREGDVVVATKLDRLGRSVADLANIAKQLEADGVGLVILDQGIDTTTAAGKMMFHMIAAVAEFELALRYERQMEGIAKAKESGVQFGRKPTIDAGRVIELREQGFSMGKIADQVGCSKGAVHKILAAAVQAEVTD